MPELQRQAFIKQNFHAIDANKEFFASCPLKARRPVQNFRINNDCAFHC